MILAVIFFFLLYILLVLAGLFLFIEGIAEDRRRILIPLGVLIMIGGIACMVYGGFFLSPS